jgi:hypothetical protein
LAIRSPQGKAAAEMEDMEKTAVDDEDLEKTAVDDEDMEKTARGEGTKRGAEKETKTTDVTTWTSLALAQFFSLSLKEYFLKNYMIDDNVVARLCIPAGFSIVVTNEIHSGLMTEGRCTYL